MSVVVWGLLTKSAEDSTKIEEEIDDRIATHNADPDSHGLADMALYAHRTGDVLDHLDASILAAKIKDGEIDPRKVTQFIYFTFESIDGFVTYGTVVPYTPGVKIEKSGVVNGIAFLDTLSAFVKPAFTKKSFFETIFNTALLTNVRNHVVTGSSPEAVGQSTCENYGFVFEDTLAYALVTKAGVEYRTQITIPSLLYYDHRLRAEFYPGDRVDFYVDGVLKHSETANLPSLAAPTMNSVIWLYMLNKVTYVRSFYICYWLFWQEPFF